MKADRFFSVHYDMRHNPKIELLRDMGDGIIELGRWLALMSILYDVDGLYDISTKAKRRYLCKELELDDTALDGFLSLCAECDLISGELLKMNHVVSPGVSEQLDYYKQKSEAGKKGNEKRWGSAKKSASRTCESHK